jgi:hypothetical protein
MMGTVLYQVAERFGTIFLKEIAIWATRPLDATPFSDSLCPKQSPRKLLAQFSLSRERDVANIIA